MTMDLRGLAPRCRTALLPILLGLAGGGCARWSAVIPVGGEPEPEPTYRLMPGQLVRVMAPSFGLDRATATVLGKSGDSIVLGGIRVESARAMPPADTARRALPLASLGSLEIYVGRRPDPAAGAMAGALVFGALGVAIWSGRNDCSIGFESVPCAIPGALVGAAVGAAAGGAFGQAVLRTARWERIPLDRQDRIQIGIEPGPRGRVRVAASIAF